MVNLEQWKTGCCDNQADCITSRAGSAQWARIVWNMLNSICLVYLRCPSKGWVRCLTTLLSMLLKEANRGDASGYCCKKIQA